MSHSDEPNEVPRSRVPARLLNMIEGGGLTRFLSALGPTAVALGFQFVAFAIVARGLGVVAFGQYAALLSVAAIGIELVGLGGADLLVRAVARDRSRFPAFFGNMLLLIGLTLVPLLAIGLYVALAAVGTTIGPWHVVMVLLGEVLIGRISASVELVMVAHNHTFRASCVRLASAGVRLAVTIGYFAFAHSLEGWIEAVLVQSMILSLVFIAVAVRLYGRPRFVLQTGELGVGIAFGANQAARATQGNIDRVILARFADDGVLGAYAAGARLLQIGLFPLQAMTRILYPQFFRHGEEGLRATRRFALRCVPQMLAIGVLASAAVALVGLFAPALLGRDFAAASHSAILLGLSLPLIALQYLAGDTLTGAGFQHIRAVIYTIAALAFGVVLSIGAGVGGVNGLIAAFLGAHALLAATLWIVAFALPVDARKS